MEYHGFVWFRACVTPPYMSTSLRRKPHRLGEYETSCAHAKPVSGFPPPAKNRGLKSIKPSWFLRIRGVSCAFDPHKISGRTERCGAEWQAATKIRETRPKSRYLGFRTSRCKLFSTPFFSSTVLGLREISKFGSRVVGISAVACGKS